MVWATAGGVDRRHEPANASVLNLFKGLRMLSELP